MVQENKDHFGWVLRLFIDLHPFSTALFLSREAGSG